MQRNLFVDVMSNGEYSREVIESSKTNDWGIPDSRTLPPLSNKVVDQLDNGGKVTLVGSGPGDPDLLTVKALKLLQDPDALVICDRLVSDEIVNLIQGEVKVARKLPGCAELAQEEIYFWAHQGLRNGKHVIRLKIGDPFVFGRGGEEILTFRTYGVEPSVIPVSFDRIEFCVAFVTKLSHTTIIVFVIDREFLPHFPPLFLPTFPSLIEEFRIRSSCARGTVAKAPLRI